MSTRRKISWTDCLLICFSKGRFPVAAPGKDLYIYKSQRLADITRRLNEIRGEVSYLEKEIQLGCEQEQQELNEELKRCKQANEGLE